MKNVVNKEYAETLEYGQELIEPSLFQVVLHNDDFTPMEFVVGILEKFFNLGRQRATHIMMEVHLKGRAAIGLFTKDVADTKVSQVVEHARFHDHPLICSTEAAS